VLAGQEAIQNRIEELRKAGAKKYRLIIKDLESLLKSPSAAVASAKRNAADATKPSQKPLETDDESEGEAAKADKESQPSWTPLVPSHSLLSEVTVESRDEGSSSEEEDGIAQEPEQEEPEPEPGQPSLEDVDLDAIMRGPGPIKLNNLIDTLESKEGESDTEDDGDDIGPLEVEDDGENERKYRRLSQRWADSSEEEGDEDDESEQHSIPPPKPPAGPDETSNVTDPAGNKKDGAQGDAFDTDATRVSVSKVQDSDLAKVAGEASEAADLDNASDTSPARDNKADDTNDDPIEPADDLMEVQEVIISDIDPIEVTTPPIQKIARPLAPVAHSTPKSGLAKRMKNRHGQLPSPSQFPVRADESKVAGSQKAGAEGKKKNAAIRTANDKPSIRSSKGVTRADLPRISSQPAKRSTNLNGYSATPSHSQPLPKPPASLAKWSALRESSPSIFMDELNSSLIGQGGILGKLAGNASEPHSAGGHSSDDSADKVEGSFFTLPASQVPFPHSQYNASLQKRMEVVPDSEPESEAETVGKKKKATNAKSRRSIPPYRRLTDIASQASLFSQSTPAAPRTGATTNGMGGQADDDDDDDDSSSESDDEGQSHIPQAKRAGKLRSKKTKGLLASIVY
jgi:hypothetical protein